MNRKNMAVVNDTTKYKKFLEHLLLTGNIKKSAEYAKLSRADVYKKRKTDEVFSKDFEEIKKLSAEILEDEAFRRAIDGTDKNIYFKGEVIDTIKVYSDALLNTLLKGNMPEKYAEFNKSYNQDIASMLIKQLEKLKE